MSLNRPLLQFTSSLTRPSTNASFSFSQRLQQQNRDWTCPRCRVQLARQQQQQQQRRRKSDRALSRGKGATEDGALPETLDQRTSTLLQQCRPLPFRFGRLEDEAVVEYSDLGPIWENEMKPRPQVAGPVRLRYTDKRNELTRALTARSPEWLLRALDEVIEDKAYIGSLSSTQFTAILELLDPEFLVKDFQLAHYNLYKPYKMWVHEMDLQHTLDGYARKMEMLLNARISAGKNLGVTDFKAFLKIARATGKRDLAGCIWETMQTQGVGPDIDCFKNFMGAVVWNGYYADDGAEGKLRHTESYKEAHKHGRTTLFNNGRNFLIGGSGIMVEIERLTEQMNGQGINGDQDTYVFQMIAAAREGRLDIVKSILHTSWGINAENINDVDDQLPLASALSESSPLAVSPRLMHAIVHCFCCNNDLATALNLVGYISRTNGVTIPPSIWSLIFEWSFILSKRRYGRISRETGQFPPPYPEGSLVTVWQTMLSFPYKILPSPPMLARLIARMYERGLKNSFLSAVSLSQGCQDSSRIASDTAMKKVQRAIDRGWPEELIQPLRQKLRVLEVLRKRNHKYIRRWLEQALALSLSPMNYVPYWESRGLLDLLRKYESYLPEVVSFHTVTGHVTFRSRAAQDVVAAKQQQASVSAQRLQAAFSEPPVAAAKHWESISRSAEASYRLESDNVLHLQREFRLERKMQDIAARAEHALRKRMEKEVARGQKAYDSDEQTSIHENDSPGRSDLINASLVGSEADAFHSSHGLGEEDTRRAIYPAGNGDGGLEPRFGVA